MTESYTSGYDPLAEIGNFEYLPFSNAFRRLTETYWNRKTTVYQSSEPFVVHNVVFPEAFSIASSLGRSIFEALDITMIQKRNEFQGEGSMKINGVEIELDFDEVTTKLGYDSAVGNHSGLRLPTDVLATFFLNILGSDQRISEEDKTILFQQSPTTPDLLRKVFENMSMLRGQYVNTTRAVFSEPPEFAYIADLIDGETPSNNASVLNIDLSHLLDEPEYLDAEELDSHQEAILLSPEEVGVVYQRATIIPEGALSPEDFVFAKELGKGKNQKAYVVEPKANFDQWFKVCSTFNRYIAPLMMPFAYLDEEVDEEPTNIDFPDPKTFLE